MSADESAQMMLLSAFIFVIGLLALSAALARVSLLAAETTREQDRPIHAHVTPMLEAVNDAIDRLDPELHPSLVAGSAAFEGAVRDLLAHLAALEAAQGFILEWRIECDGSPPNPAQAYALLILRDGRASFEARTSTFSIPACP